MPVVLGKINNHGHQHWERLIFISLEDVQEVVVLKEAHRSVCHLQVDTADALHDALEQAGYEVLNTFNLANLEYLLQLS